MGGAWLNQIDERDVERDEADEFELADEVAAAAEEQDDEISDELDSALGIDGGYSPIALDEQVAIEDPLFDGRLLFESATGPEPDREVGP